MKAIATKRIVQVSAQIGAQIRRVLQPEVLLLAASVFVLALGSGCQFDDDDDWNNRWDYGNGGYFDAGVPSYGSSSWTSPLCSRDDACGPACYCDRVSRICSNSSLCTRDRDCRSGFVCDRRNTCVPNAPFPSFLPGPPDAGWPAWGDSGGPDAGPPPATGGTPPATGGTPPATEGESSIMCRFDNQCGPGGRCRNGLCQRGCTSSATCGTGDICLGGVCQPSPQPGSACLYNSDCPGEAACINGTCHQACASAAQCSNPADICDHGLCKPDFKPVPQCRASAECAAGDSCVNAICRTPCWANSDCGAWASGSICEGGFCLLPQEITPECSNNQSCSAGSVCENALCVNTVN